ncbi:Putative nucleoside transporter YegT [Aquisphaera giovannonii]|uniref:Nucleoside transporter YegT n=1 Tax=Aquisphaera giovannonii TaxID=406548 RepID=A0A5B9W072_9BACT|nr:MFS transporter [Aquisphaera giovannonii]QEH33671.1 Putative nucleoside transporter YegT [Aquisphaera giovannonii]
MTFATRVKLSVMMFLQYFVWGIWLPMLAQRLGKNDLNLSANEIGWIFTVYGIGAIIGPFVLGQLADRYFATERVMAVAHFLGGLLLIVAAYLTTFWPIFIALLLYCNLYMPTMALSNSISFRSLGEENQHYFPKIRFWGTVGWIAAGLFFAGYLEYNNLSFYQSLFDLVGAHGAFESFLAGWRASVVPLLKPIFALPFVGEPKYWDCLRLSGAFSLGYALYCLFLPHTPPLPAKETDPVDKKSAALESLELMEYRSFAVLVLVAGLVGIMLAFYFACENYFLEAIGVPPTQTGAYMTIGQISEALVMLFVPAAVSRLGIKATMLIGAGAWAARFGLSALGYPFWLMITTIALHGFAFGFFFVVAQMYVDRAASRDIKASAQSLLIFVVYGLGTVLGSVLTGPIRRYFTETVNGATVENWHGIWMGPFLLTIFCMVVFGLLFKEEQFGKGGGVEELEPATAPVH